MHDNAREACDICGAEYKKSFLADHKMVRHPVIRDDRYYVCIDLVEDSS